MELINTSWKDEFVGKKILIWGFGREGISSYHLIRKLSDQVIYIADGNTSIENQKRIQDLTTNTVFVKQEEIDFDGYDLILKSPGIVVEKGVNLEHLSSQSDLFLKHYRKQTIGITGTKGKSTTTSMLYEALRKKYNVHLVGNIGIPCFEAIEGMEQGDLATFEISCHQLEYAHYSPFIGVYLNLFEEHLDHYDSFKAYGDAKAHIFTNMEENDMIIIHKDLEQYVSMIKHPILIGKDIQSKGHTLIVNDHTLSVDCALIGQHNYTNMGVCYYIAHYLGVSDEDFVQAMIEFKPLNHRLMDLGTHNGIRYVDDSISTIGQSCISALISLPDTQTVLVGGMDRGIDYTDLKQYLKNRLDLNIIFMYASGKRIYDEMMQEGLIQSNMVYVEDLFKAMDLAKKITDENKIVLLSPAASSYDHFKNFEERGDVFRKVAFEE